MSESTKKVAVVTGGTRGIGLAISHRLLADGFDVLATYRGDIAAAEAAAQELQAAAGARTVQVLAADIATADGAGLTIETAVKELGRIDALINNAGITRDARALKMAEGDFRAVVRVNIVAPLRLAETLAGYIEDGGAIVNIASRAGLGNFGQANYVAAKAALMGATRALALRWAPGLRVNAVAPGLVNTPMTAAMPPDVLEKLVARVPAGRAAEVAEIAQVVAFLTSAQASYVTGQTLLVCGGRSLAQ
jgi:NAD(P)-dependent dehydrogenase (short-subunit alcohol dehydrogenase family)